MIYTNCSMEPVSRKLFKKLQENKVILFSSYMWRKMRNRSLLLQVSIDIVENLKYNMAQDEIDNK